MQELSELDQTADGMAEKVVIACSYCEKKYLVPTEMLGRHTTCSACGQRFAIVCEQGDGSETIDSSPALEVPRQSVESMVLENSDDGGVTLDASTLIDKVAGIENLRSHEHTDRYSLGREIARGGMGSILQSRDQNLRRSVAMKIILPSKMTHLKIMRFIEEAQITGQLEHPNIVPVHELGIDADGQVFYTMKLINGKTLSEILTDLARGDEATIKKYKLVNLIEILIRVCDALSYAHSKGVVHRDLKPENIMIGDFGEVQVMDWGLAKIVSKDDGKDVAIEELEEYEPDSDARLQAVETVRSEQRADVTLEGNILGTPQYMAPEQAEGKISQIDQTTDIYALGGIFYEILTLRPPVRSENIKSMIEKVIKGELIPPVNYNGSSKDGSSTGTRIITRRHKPSEHEPAVTVTEEIQVIHLKHCPHRRIPRSLSAVCMKAMSRQQWQRYQQVSDFQKDLNAYLRGYATEAEGASSIRRITLFLSRHKSESLLITAAVLIIITLVWSFIHNLQASEEAALQAMAQADQSRNIAESKQEIARQTIERLRLTVPTFVARTRQLIIEQQYDKALEAVDVALNIDVQCREAWELQGNIYQTLLRFEESLSSYENALSLKDSDSLRRNMALSRSILEQQEAGTEISTAALRQIHEAYLADNRFAEAITILSKMNADAAEQYNTWNAILDGLHKQGVISYTLDVDPESGLLLLSINESKLSNLSSIRGMPLMQFTLVDSNINDISVLAGMSLTQIHLIRTAVQDISVLRGMDLNSVSISGSPISSISVLAGMPIKTLDISLSKVRDIRYLTDMPLRSLNISFTKVTNISSLSGMSLEYLNLEDCSIRDVRPLAEMTSLKEIILPNSNFDMRIIRALPNLETIGFNDESKKPAMEFWADWDAVK